ncbi:iron complex transport system permease protein [Paenibacillus sp. UNCCL117]|uniref:FecCD family ABC transporter permease n=1 Tax=unclassified Paenibacillus TaxID=185978 RepID=UPI00088BD031|nr:MULTISPECIES: iron ABC transporter permease [unclassified Paenibacillus]SDC90359.1 bacillibactin ABC transporter integral membrane protein [Paenibacillus sp. cl123]SFW28820.1 iron complex transport system permease protein [Paenibacillus sp. UNCCL117]
MPKDTNLRFWTVLGAGFALLLAAVYVSLTNGSFDLTITDVVRTLLRIDPVPEHDLVVFDFRLPRIVIAGLVGLGLAIAGAVLQGVTGNGLADSRILGINAGAGAAIVIFMFFFQGQMKGAGLLATFTMPLFGLFGGLLTALLLYLFSWKNGKLDPQRLILVGIALDSGLGAITLYLSLKMKASDFEMATVWITGSIWNANWPFIVAMLPWLLVLIPVIYSKSRKLDLFQLDDGSAKSLGVATEKERSILLLASIGLVSACVAVSGGIGFIGLMAPHIARRLVGLNHRRLLPACGLIGMVMVIVSDLIAKTVFAPAELPVGIVISLVGVPYFVYLLFKARG